MIQLNTDVLL